MAAEGSESPRKVSVARHRPIFSTRTATEDVSRLAPSESVALSPEDSNRRFHLQVSAAANPYAPLTAVSRLSPRRHSHTQKLLDSVTQWWYGPGHHHDEEGGLQGRPLDRVPTEDADHKNERSRHKPRTGTNGTSEKLGTFSGVFVPTTLNVLSILMFLRFGFILGQGGVLGMMGMLVAAYIINLLTTMSISAIATNGTVRGGGAYYLISRSLGPEFGGSIGVVFYMGFVFNTGMNALGLVDCFIENFGIESGSWVRFLPQGFWWQYTWATIVVVLCTAICLAGSSIFVRASNGLLAVLLVATFSIPFSAFFMQPFYDPGLGVEFTGFRLQTFLENLKPHLTKGAAGSQIQGRENFQDLFGILFPATGGIFAGASMSGDLKNPSKSIPKGTLAGLGLTFFTYTVVILVMAASITRQSFYNNVNVIQITNVSGILVLLGEFASCFFSSLMGVIGSAKLLQAIAKDNLIPGLSIFSEGNKKSGEPTYAIIFTFVVTQVSMLFDINRIASFITMTYLMTFLATNLACFLLKIGSAPNFRPSFHYFNWQTAAAGALFSGVIMFFVDGIYATGCVVILIVLFLLIHYTSPPKSWGDVSQSLIYHQVRKYLLRLRQEHVKFWRPQILLFVHDLETQYKMIHFCNSLKKGALFVLGHVIVTDDFSSAVPEARRQQTAWAKFIEYSKVKAFTNISVAPTAEWGVRNTVLNSGLGGMRPNIVVIDQFRRNQSLVEVFRQPLRRRHSQARSISLSRRDLGDDSSESGVPDVAMSPQSYLTILEDLLFKLRINVAVARGFENLELPNPKGRNTKRFIDLWPIQMSAELAADSESKQNVLTTNFDTYTLILQLGCILHTVPSWKKTYKLRVVVFVEYETDVEEERGRVETLLEKLRIEAEVLVFALASGDLQTYKIIVNGDTSASAEALEKVDSVLKEESWWQDIQKFRESSQDPQRRGQTSKAAKLLGAMPYWPAASFQQGGQRPASSQRFEGLKKLVQSAKRQRRRSISSFQGMNVNLGMQTHRLLDSFVDYHSDASEDSSSTEDTEFEPYVSDAEDDNEEEDDGSTPRTGTASPFSRREASSPNPPRSRLRRSQSAHVLRSSEEEETAVSEMAPPDRTTTPENVPAITAPAAEGETSADIPMQQRPPLPRTASGIRFSSSPIPEARVNPTEGTGPSIMFSDSPVATRPPDPDFPSTSRESIYTRHAAASASGFPAQAAMPLSFNDLPCRAQHLILNELMTRQSGETAVMFTTLPSPIEGTCADEAGSEAYVNDMEVLCQDLPPCLLVHSNSMTVTMNL
ncbi:hypothetical protein VTN77DRAFT_5076 [Rasamsonia byssochlamydoides]|uniref:uncharacterized protein n=1 Tax=Rasamsonia byssochlamydoides TaxID=89139 RepID=UPI0037437D45